MILRTIGLGSLMNLHVMIRPDYKKWFLECCLSVYIQRVG